MEERHSAEKQKLRKKLAAMARDRCVLRGVRDGDGGWWYHARTDERWLVLRWRMVLCARYVVLRQRFAEGTMRNAVLRWRMVLRAMRYAVLRECTVVWHRQRGEGPAYQGAGRVPLSVRYWYGRWYYAMCVTGIGYGTMRYSVLAKAIKVCDVRSRHRLWRDAMCGTGLGYKAI
eukprot:2243633-Rhodomonas_salina.1